MDAWLRFRAADGELVAAAEELAGSDPGSLLSAVIAGRGGGELLAALAFVGRHGPPGFVESHVDALLPLAVQGGAEQPAAQALVESADRAAVRPALAGLVDVVVRGGGDRYLEYAGLLSLLDRLGETALRRRVVEAARHAADPDVRELVADDTDEADGGDGADEADGGDGADGSGRPGAAAPPDIAAESWRRWNRYVAAWTGANEAWHGLPASAAAAGVQADLAGGADAGAAARLVARYLATPGVAGVERARRVVAVAADRDRLMRLVAGEVLADTTHLRGSFARLLDLLAEIGPADAFDRAIAYGLGSASAELRQLSKSRGRNRE